jgi:hypothetical protein
MPKEFTGIEKSQRAGEHSPSIAEFDQVRRLVRLLARRAAMQLFVSNLRSQIDGAPGSSGRFHLDNL